MVLPFVVVFVLLEYNIIIIITIIDKFTFSSVKFDKIWNFAISLFYPNIHSESSLTAAVVLSEMLLALAANVALTVVHAI